MFRLDIDITDVIDAEDDAREALSRIPRAMEGAVRLGAEFAKSAKRYQDRTGTLSRMTRGRTDRSSRNETSVELESATEYAEYVRRRGLMAIDSGAARTDREIEDRLGRIADEVAGK